MTLSNYYINYRTTVETFITTIIKLYDIRKKEYMKSLDKVSENKLLEENKETKIKPKKSNKLGYSFYSYKDVIKSIGKPTKKKDIKEKFSLSLGDSLNTEVKKDNSKNNETYIAIAQGNFTKLLKENEIIAKLQDKITQLSEVAKSIDGIKERLNKQIKQLTEENEAIENENKKCYGLITEYKRDPKKFNLSNFQKILAKSAIKPESSSKHKTAKKDINSKLT